MRYALPFAAVCLFVPRGVGAMGWTHKKRRGAEPGPSSDAAESLSCAAGLLNFVKPAAVYHMDNPTDRETLLQTLWVGEYWPWVGRFTQDNPALDSLFHSLKIDGEHARVKQKKAISWPRFENIFRCYIRARSQKYVPLETAALSVCFHHYKVPHPAWEAVAALTKAVMAHSWTEQLCEDALALNPNPIYKTACGMTAAVFDNLEMKVGYGSYATSDSSAHRIPMTNWATAFLPSSAVGSDFDIRKMLGSGGIFRTDLVLDEFKDLFNHNAPDLVAMRRQRWFDYFELAARGILWVKENYDSPHPKTYFEWHDPIWDRLQASYEDVNFELDLMRSHKYHMDAHCIQLGGDGLSYMRLIHRLSQDPRRFLQSTPVVIPRLGEAPHGKFHLMHGGWRLWAPLILKMAAVAGNTFVKADPTISEFNEHEHFLRIVVEAFCEYVIEIGATGSDHKRHDSFIRFAMRNLSFAYICMFLDLFGFAYVQFRKSVHKNDSKTLDKLWRENLTTARTSKANKTNYSKMSVVLVYWGCALREPLQSVFHATRTLRWINTHVGWDFPIEQLNNWIKASVKAHVTKEQIRKFISHVNFTHCVSRGLLDMVQRERADRAEYLKPIQTTKDLIKEYLRDKIGRDFATATQESDANLLNLDMLEWGGDRNDQQRRNGAPWEQMRRDSQNFRDYVGDAVSGPNGLCKWHMWR